MIKEDKKSETSVPNVERALTILEHLSEHREGLGLSEICANLGYPNNSVFRITQTLLNRNFILRDLESKKFTLSRKLLSIGYAALHENNIIKSSTYVMKELSIETGETALLATVMENEGIILEQVPGTHAFKFVVDRGTRFPLHSSAPGKAYLAFLDQEEQKKICTKIKFPKFTENTITSLRDFNKELALIKQRGYSIDNEEEREGVICLGAPIYDYHGLPIASLFITGPKDRMSVKNISDYGEKLRQGAKRISNKLGWD